MALTVQTRTDPQGLWVADRRLYLTADKSEAVEDGDARAAFLLCGVGQSIPKTQAEALGLLTEPKTKTGGKAKKPPADKSKKPPADKGTRSKDAK